MQHSDLFTGEIRSRLKYAGRTESASPATGSYEEHKLELEAIMQTVF